MAGQGQTIIRLSVFDDSGGDDGFAVELESGRTRVRAHTKVTLSDHDRRNLQWYLEEYLLETYPPGPERAARIEQRMAELGEQLFYDLFQANGEASDLWAKLRDRLPGARIEISAPAVAAASIPWELLRDRRSGRYLALSAGAFVRVPSAGALDPVLPELRDGDRLRVLLVICRPDGAQDVGLRSVAGRLLRSINGAGRERIDLTLLRPPTFDRLTAELRAARDRGEPWHIVHFDGHGGYSDHGFLVFEGDDDQPRYIDGPTIGRALRDHGVSVLLLNACRSGHADQPDKADAAPTASQGEQVAVFGSLAQQVVDAGVAGVLAMRYNLWVVTAAQYVETLYAGLAAGDDLATAANRARHNLADRPSRRIAGAGADLQDLQDWQVPVLFEAAAVTLLPRAVAAAAPLLFDVNNNDWTIWPGSDGRLPRPPETGFIGRDETLLALDRAFDRQRVVLLHAFAGAGKTATAAEFARWYAATDGLGAQPLVLFDSFETYDHGVTLAGLLDRLADLFESLLQQQNIHWGALDAPRRRQVALNLLRQIPLLWIWDNVEPVAGFPAGAESSWTAAQQRELADFLRDVNGGTGAGRILLTSRRDERGWLGDSFPRRVTVPPLRRADQLALAEKLAENRGRAAGFCHELAPLLDYSAGNPMTLTILVGQALRDGLTSRAQVAAYVEALQRGEGRFDDDRAQGRTRSLGASLAYGFDQAFAEDERRRLALLALFHGFVNVDALVWMGHPQNPGRQAGYAGLTRDDWSPLLRRAADIGLLTDHSGGTFSIHPALPWFLLDLFDQYWPGGHDGDDSPAHAYAVAMSSLGNEYWRLFNSGQRDAALAGLQAEEGNLRHALALAHRHDWGIIAFGVLQGLRNLYIESGRWEAWRQAVTAAEPLVVGPDHYPRPGHEGDCLLWMEYAGNIAAYDHDEARQLDLLHSRVMICREWADPFLTAPADEVQHNIVRSLAANLQQFGAALVGTNDPQAVTVLQEAMALNNRIGDRKGEVIVALSLSNAYMNIIGLRDFDAAAGWCDISLELSDNDADRAMSHYQLGLVAKERFLLAAQNGGADPEALIDLLRQAETAYKMSLRMTPADDHAKLAVVHNLLGEIYRATGMIDDAARHYGAAIRHQLAAGERYPAGQIRYNVALMHLRQGRFADARAYARTALDDFRAYAGRAADREALVEQLLADIDAAEAQSPLPSGERVG